MGSATGGGRAARWEFHFLVGGQDTQDTQDTHDGGKVGFRASERLAGQEMAARLRTKQAQSWESWVSWVSWPRHWSREAAKCLSGHWLAAFSCAAKMAAFPVSGCVPCGRNKLRPSRSAADRRRGARGGHFDEKHRVGTDGAVGR